MLATKTRVKDPLELYANSCAQTVCLRRMSPNTSIFFEKGLSAYVTNAEIIIIVRSLNGAVERSAVTGHSALD